MSLYSVVRGCYHLILPEPLRHGLYMGTPRSLKRLRRFVVQTIERTGEHNEIYDAAYYAKFVEPTMQMSASAMADSICREFMPGTAIDVGCGTGVLMAVLRERGVKVQGFEYSDAALDICRDRGLTTTKLDIEHDPFPDLQADVVISTEVAEHLPKSCADRFVSLLSSLSSTVVLTAAVPGAGPSGTDHVNEQPNEYWISKFEARSYRFDDHLAQTWRSEWSRKGVAACFASSVMVFRAS